MASRSPEHFRSTLAWVALTHLVLLLLLMTWIALKPKPTPPPQFINMVNLGDLVKGRPGPSEGPVVGNHYEPAAPAPPAAAPKAAPRAIEPPQPRPPAPQPPAVKPVEPAPAVENATPPAPTPKVADPTAWTREKIKPQPKPVTPNLTPSSTSTTTTTRPKVKVDLSSEVSRESSASANHTSKMHASAVDGDDEEGTGTARAGEGQRGRSAKGVAETLGAAIHNSGVDKAVGIGPSGSPGGTSGANSWYYTLIRDQMYEAWDMPTSLAGKKLQTLIRILVEKNGAISNVELVRSSGNKEHDDSAMAAVRHVGRIRQPLPDGMDGNIEINFRLTE